MEGRQEIANEMLEDIVGGALRWQGGYVFPKDNPDHKYSFSDYEKCTKWIRDNWGGQVQDEDTLIALENAGLISKAY